AVSRALTAFADTVPDGAAIALFVDNTSALAGVRRQYSHSYAMNSAAGEYRRVVTQHELLVSAAYVRTDQNPADAPSRAWGLEERMTGDVVKGKGEPYGVNMKSLLRE